MQIAFWHLQESLNELRIAEFPVDVQLSIMRVKHPKRRLELAIANHIWLRELGFAKAFIKSETGKPIYDSKVKLSVSHSGKWLVVGFTDSNEINQLGIDFELPNPRIVMLKSKFLADDECFLFDLQKNEIETLTKAWVAKEACYKCFGEKGVDWKQDMKIVEAKDSSISIKYSTSSSSVIVNIDLITLNEGILGICAC